MSENYLDPFDYSTSDSCHAAPQRQVATQIKTQEALHEHLGSLKEKTPAIIKIPQGSKMVEISLPDKRLTINRYFSALKDLDLGKYPLRYVVSDSYAYRDRLKEVGIDRPVDSIRIMDAVLYGKDIDRFAKGETRAEDMMTLFQQLGSQLNRSPNVPWYQLLRDAQPYIGSLPGFRVDTKKFSEILIEIGKDENQANTVTLWTDTLRQYGDHFPAALIPGGTIHGRLTAKKPAILSMDARLRKGLYANGGNTLTGVDFHQMQPRIIAERCKDPVFRGPFVERRDYYRVWASFIFTKPEAEISGEERSIAKAVALHWLFGQGKDNLSKLVEETGYDKDAAMEGIRNFENACSRLRTWKMQLEASVRRRGYVETVSGRRIPMRKEDAWLAMNYSTTGTEVEIMLHAIMKLGKRLRDEQLDARISLLVYDELIVETSPACQTRVEALMKECLTDAFHEMLPDAPMDNLLEVHADPCWGNLK